MNEKESHQMKKQSEQKNPLAELADESGLGALFGNSHHGLGLFPVRSLDTVFWHPKNKVTDCLNLATP